jgi:hypothetical protein
MALCTHANSPLRGAPHWRHQFRIAVVPGARHLPCAQPLQGIWRACWAAQTAAAPSGGAPLVAPATPIARHDGLDFQHVLLCLRFSCPDMS